MKISLKDLESNVVNTSLEVKGQEVELEDVFSGIGIKTNQGVFGIVQRDGGIEVRLDGKPVFQSTAETSIVLEKMVFEGEVRQNLTDEIIDEYEGFGVRFPLLRKQMGDAILDDPDLEIGYRSNIAMLLHDYFNRADFKDHGVRNEAARMILQLVFRS